ncbi:hypothetical protein [Thiohalocapsa sp. ML1]|uniref:hypothetical protein n=1 Tax=Thiohalocapsa sp. ML1 TaxID=1431688 RepID=UPI001C1F70E8|nr:hypothetical protein [Thiohalocapsa sp. ML1]
MKNVVCPRFSRRAAYRSLFEDELSAEVLGRLRECTNGGFVLGSEKFERQIAAMLGRRTWKAENRDRPRFSKRKTGTENRDDGKQGQTTFFC